MTTEERSDENGTANEGDVLTTADLAARTPEADDKPEAGDTPEAESSTDDAGRAPAGESSAALFEADETKRFQSRWSDIQTGFVDRPREMVEQADALVADLMQRLAAQFSDERSRLETQWDKDDDVSTEELRVALTRYRSFFERLLNA
jgi:hypothetical protein